MAQRPDATDRGDPTGPDREPALTRRAVLAGSAVTLGGGVVGTSGLAGASGTAAGQITQVAVVPRPTEWPDANYAGFMVHVGPTTDPGQEMVAEDCDHESWPPDEVLAYEATLINRKEGETPEEDTTLFVGGSADVPSGALYLINTFVRCNEDYLGVNLEQIGRYDVGGAGGERATDYGPVEEVEPDERTDQATESPEDGGPGAVGPGFGPLATLAALLGGGGLLARGTNRDASDPDGPDD